MNSFEFTISHMCHSIQFFFSFLVPRYLPTIVMISHCYMDGFVSFSFILFYLFLYRASMIKFLIPLVRFLFFFTETGNDIRIWPED